MRESSNRLGSLLVCIVLAGVAPAAAEGKALEAGFKASRDHFGFGETEQQELFAIVGSTRGDIVVE